MCCDGPRLAFPAYYVVLSRYPMRMAKGSERQQRSASTEAIGDWRRLLSNCLLCRLFGFEVISTYSTAVVPRDHRRGKIFPKKEGWKARAINNEQHAQSIASRLLCLICHIANASISHGYLLESAGEGVQRPGLTLVSCCPGEADKSHQPLHLLGQQPICRRSLDAIHD